MTHPRPVPIPRRFEGRTVVVTGAGHRVRCGHRPPRRPGGRQGGRHPLPVARDRAPRRRPDGSRRPAPPPRSSRPTSPSGTSVKAFAQRGVRRPRRGRRGDQQRRRRGPRADVVARPDRGVRRPRAGRRHQGHDGVHARVRLADARPGLGLDRQHRLDGDRPRQRAGPAVRRGEVRHPRPHQVLRPRLRPDRAGQRLRPRLHRDRGHARPARTGRRAAATSSGR